MNCSLSAGCKICPDQAVHIRETPVNSTRSVWGNGLPDVDQEPTTMNPRGTIPGRRAMHDIMRRDALTLNENAGVRVTPAFIGRHAR